MDQLSLGFQFGHWTSHCLSVKSENDLYLGYGSVDLFILQGGRLGLILSGWPKIT